MKYKLIIIFILFSCYLFSQQLHYLGADSLSPNNVYVYVLYSTDNVLYVSGAFTHGGTTQLNGSGIWDGNQWTAMGSGYTGQCIAKYYNKIYFAGGYSGIPATKYIAVWDGTNWGPLPSSYGQLNSQVRDLAVCDSILFIGSDFPGGSATRVTAWDKSQNDYINVGSLPSNVLALETYNGEVYAGGSWFSLKKYNGGTGYAAWEDVGGNCNDFIQDMAVDTFNNFLYVCGGFYAVDDSILTDYVAYWNGFYWESISQFGILNYYNGAIAIGLYNGDVYAGLTKDSINGIYTGQLIRWDGQQWHSVMGGEKMWIDDFEVFQDKLYIGGAFDSVGGQPCKGMVAYSHPLDTVDCHYIQPRAFTLADTFYLNSGQANVQFYNNNAYVDSWSWDFGDGGSSTNKDPLYHYHDTGTYVVSVSVTHNNCPVKTATKTITILNGTGIAELNKESLAFKLYPNPTKNMFYAEISLPAKTEAELRITGLNGHIKNIIPLTATKTPIETHGWSNGIYLCNLFVNGKFVLTEKMVLAK
jgi:hypothetical protein